MKTETEVKSQLSHLQNLIRYMSKSSDFKQQIFDSFTKIDLQKIESLRSFNLEIRKLSLKFVCFLIHSNHRNKIDFCKLMDISPSNGRIVLNSFPKSLLVRTQIPQLLKKLNSPIDISSDTFCLFYDLTSQKLEQLKKDSYPQFDFLDPKQTLVVIDSYKYVNLLFRYTKPIYQSIQAINPLIKHM